MKKQIGSNAKLNYITLTLFLISVVLGINAGSSANRLSTAQEKPEDKIIKHFQDPTRPVEIIDVKVKGKAIKLNEKINEDADDWLDDMSLTVKNISDKTITYIQLDLDFPETKSTGTLMRFILRYGKNPRALFTTNPLEPLLPNQTATFHLSDQTLAGLKKFMETRQPLNRLKKVDLMLEQVFFEDGTWWFAGSLFRPDPNNPKKYIRIDN